MAEPRRHFRCSESLPILATPGADRTSQGVFQAVHVGKERQALHTSTMSLPSSPAGPGRPMILEFGGQVRFAADLAGSQQGSARRGMPSIRRMTRWHRPRLRP